jgi:hypothetical protein
MDLVSFMALAIAICMLVVFVLGIRLPFMIWSGWAVVLRAPGALDGMVARWTADPWPVGVQEEDRERVWGAGTAPVHAGAPEPEPSGAVLEELPGGSEAGSHASLTPLRASVTRPRQG